MGQQCIQEPTGRRPAYDHTTLVISTQDGRATAYSRIPGLGRPVPTRPWVSTLSLAAVFVRSVGAPPGAVVQGDVMYISGCRGAAVTPLTPGQKTACSHHVGVTIM